MIERVKKYKDLFALPVHGCLEQTQKEKQEIRIDVPQKNLKKFKEVLLYILEKVGGKPNVGMTVLYKLLYFIDFDYYEKFEEQLIGATYIKNHFDIFSDKIHWLDYYNQSYIDRPIMAKQNIHRHYQKPI
jgi:hypothetical protein